MELGYRHDNKSPTIDKFDEGLTFLEDLTEIKSISYLRHDFVEKFNEYYSDKSITNYKFPRLYLESLLFTINVIMEEENNISDYSFSPYIFSLSIIPKIDKNIIQFLLSEDIFIIFSFINKYNLSISKKHMYVLFRNMMISADYVNILSAKFDILNKLEYSEGEEEFHVKLEILYLLIYYLSEDSSVDNVISLFHSYLRSEDNYCKYHIFRGSYRILVKKPLLYKSFITNEFFIEELVKNINQNCLKKTKYCLKILTQLISPYFFIKVNIPLLVQKIYYILYRDLKAEYIILAIKLLTKWHSTEGYPFILNTSTNNIMKWIKRCCDEHQFLLKVHVSELICTVILNYHPNISEIFVTQHFMNTMASILTMCNNNNKIVISIIRTIWKILTSFENIRLSINFSNIKSVLHEIETNDEDINSILSLVIGSLNDNV